MELGDPVRVVMTKWGGKPHWEYDATWLGEDAHGTWYGVPCGTLMQRPGASLVSTTDQVGLIPTGASGGGGGWVATFHAPGYVVTTYVDMTTVPTWDGPVLEAVDLDLDVIRTTDGTVFVDDEDEFAEHQLTLGYPSEVVSLAEEACAWVLESVRTGRTPFDGGSSDAWLDVLAARSRRRRD